ncbi:tigger transposable element-derived protein 2-like [Periplaneta americana]|uniref:tigger transposable element-derived protein 2-like n=1 Tax=Periplaneta americana TaxID=6978 RepID=UPI0037E71557
MVRNYKPSPGFRNYRNYSESTLEEALQLIRENKMSLNRVSQIFKIPKGTLCNKMKNKHSKNPGGQTVFTTEEEKQLCDCVIQMGDWGYPLDFFDIRIITKMLLDRMGRRVAKFGPTNLPGLDWAKSFLSRHKNVLSLRQSTNINPNRASLSREVVEQYFDNLKISLNGVPPENISNFDETNFGDDPGSKNVLIKRGSKYPERVMTHSKTGFSVMFCGTATGVLLPVYVVYKSENMWSTWCRGGPSKARYNHTKSGWFDGCTFEDWFLTVYLPHAKRLTGPKVIIGDNLSSHFSVQVIKAANENDVRFLCLPPNCTHLMQPLDVAFFRPLKGHWRKTLAQWREESGINGNLPKDVFPSLLKATLSAIEASSPANLISGFRATGIHSLNMYEVIRKLPECQFQNGEDNEFSMKLNDSVLAMLQVRRRKTATTTRRRKVAIQPGKSICIEDFTERTEPSTNQDKQVVAKKKTSHPPKQLPVAHPSEGKRNKKRMTLPDSSDESVDEELLHQLSASEDSEEGDDYRERILKEYEAEQATEDIDIDDHTSVLQGKYVLVKFCGKKTVKHYVGLLESEDEITFLRKWHSKVELSEVFFVWPTVPDKSLIEKGDICKVLPDPKVDRRGRLSFGLMFDSYNIQ